MTVLSSDTRTALIEKKTALEAILADAMTAFATSSGSDKKSYKFDSGEGAHSATKHSLKDQWDNIERLEAAIDHIDRRLNGKLNFNLNVRRKMGSALSGRRGR